jgi:hypothetical protein
VSARTPAHAQVQSLTGPHWRAQVGARLLKQTPTALRRVLAPKLGGAGNLAALTPCAPVAWAAAFSSVSALAGFAGHANYCAANAAADALAAAAAGRGAPALAVQWGAWAAVGAPGHELCMHWHCAALLDASGATSSPQGPSALGAAMPGRAVQSPAWAAACSSWVQPFKLHSSAWRTPADMPH